MTQTIPRRWGRSPSPLATGQTNQCRQSEDNHAFHWCYVSKLFVAPPRSSVLLMPHVYGSHYGLICTIKAFNEFTVSQPAPPPPQNPQNSSLINFINNSGQNFQHNFPRGNNFTQINSRRGKTLIWDANEGVGDVLWWISAVEARTLPNIDSAEL